MHPWLAFDSLENPAILKLALNHLATARNTASNALGDADARIERAADHIAALRQEIEDYSATQQDLVQATQFPDGRLRLRHHGGGPVPRILAIRIGEAVYSLRAALDYLVYGLSWLDSGRHFKRTQFPIDEEDHDFRTHRGSWLSGVSEEHAARIRSLQPVFGCYWTRSLRDASNRDKHWSPNLTHVQGFGTAVNVGAPEFVVEHEEILVVSDDDEEVIGWLEDLRLRTMIVLEDFRPDFDRGLSGSIGGLQVDLRSNRPT